MDRFFLIFITFIVTSAIAQEYKTSINLKFSNNIKYVYEEDSLHKETTIYEFDKNGFLKFYSAKTNHSSYIEKVDYKGRFIEKKEINYKNNYSNSTKIEKYLYEKGLLVRINQSEIGQDEIGDKYNNSSIKEFKYDNLNRIYKTTTTFNSGKIEKEEYNYDDSELKRKKIIDFIDDEDKPCHIEEYEYKKDSIVTINKYYDFDEKPLFVDVSIYDSKKRLNKFMGFYEGEQYRCDEYSYSESKILSLKSQEKSQVGHYILYNNFEDIEKNKVGDKEYIYKYTYNHNNDAVETRLYSNGKLINVIKCKYEYW